MRKILNKFLDLLADKVAERVLARLPKTTEIHYHYEVRETVPSPPKPLPIAPITPIRPLNPPWRVTCTTSEVK